jgi:hypothetical protein
MTESSSRPAFGQWLMFLFLAGWLALVPLVVTSLLALLNGSVPHLWAQLSCRNRSWAC